MTFVEWLDSDRDRVQEAAKAEGLRDLIRVSPSCCGNRCSIVTWANSRNMCEISCNNKGEDLRHRGSAFIRGRDMIARLWAQYQEGDHA